MKQNKLVAPNENYEVAVCVCCGKEYIKRLKNGKKKLALGVRRHNSVTCSKNCTKEHRVMRRKRLNITEREDEKK